jgi:hypothetical protein
MLSEQRHPLGQPGTAALLRDNADRSHGTQRPAAPHWPSRCEPLLGDADSVVDYFDDQLVARFAVTVMAPAWACRRQLVGCWTQHREPKRSHPSGESGWAGRRSPRRPSLGIGRSRTSGSALRKVRIA